MRGSLPVSGRNVVSCGVTENIVICFALCNILSCFPYDYTEFSLFIRIGKLIRTVSFGKIESAVECILESVNSQDETHLIIEKLCM